MSVEAVRLPEPFREFERFSDWILATEAERESKRLSSDMEEIRDFYNAVFPHVESIVSYLNQYPLDQLPEDAQRLLDLTLSMVEVANAVEIFGQPGVIDGFDPARFVPIEEEHPHETNQGEMA